MMNGNNIDDFGGDSPHGISSPTVLAQTTSSAFMNGEISIGQQIIASSVGALATSLMVTPMDVVKTRLQQQVQPIAQGECFLYSNGLMDHLCTNCEDPLKPLSKCEWFNRPGNFNGTLVSTYDAFIKITRYEGIRSLWSGLSPTMLSAIPATVFYFTIYDNILYSLRERLGDRVYVPLISGTIARAMAVSFVSPLEMMRTKMQSHKHTYRELRNAIVRTVSHDGYRSLWRGLAATLMRDIPFSAIYWTGYEYFKRKAITYTGAPHTNFLISFACGAGAGTIAAIITMPFDVVKTQQQISIGKVRNAPISSASPPSSSSSCVRVNNSKWRRSAAGHNCTHNNHLARNGGGNNQHLGMKSSWSVMRRLVETKGASSLFAGVVPRVARVAPACAIMIGSYEYLKLFFSERNATRRKMAPV